MAERLYKDQTVSYIIKDEYSNIKKSCELNQNMDKIYDYTPHPIRYTCLQYLKLVSLPISIAFYVAKLCLTANPVWTWIGVNILYQKMDQAITKKILHGLPNEIEQNQSVPAIVECVFKKYEENPSLIPAIKPTFMQKLVKKIGESFPIFSKIVNFWNEGGINYSDEIQSKRKLIEVIYKQIISKAYEVGKKGKKLEITDIKALFPEIKFEEKIAAVQHKKIEAINIVPESIVTGKYQENSNNPLVKLIILKAFYDQVQEIAEIYKEHCIVEQTYSNINSIAVNNSSVQYCSDYPQILGTGYYSNEVYGGYNLNKITC